jgi:hypothetical protein
MRLILFCIAALALAGCANSPMSGSQNMFGGGPPSRPKTVLVADFLVSSEVPAIDRGFSTRLERSAGNYPILERRQRTLERVNGEIVATIVATLRETGLEARPGSEETLKLSEDALLVSGRMRIGEQSSRKPVDQLGFGTGRSGVVADMTLSRVSGRGNKQVLTFAADAPNGRKAGAPAGKAAAAYNTAIAEALAAQSGAAEKLSPDVEAQARRLGRAVGEKVVAYAKEQGWLTSPEAAEAAPDEKPVKPAKKPAKKPEAKEKPAKSDPEKPAKSDDVKPQD